MPVGAFANFEYSHTKLVAFVFLLWGKDLLRDKGKSVFRALRKSVSSATGAHGFFAKAA